MEAGRTVGGATTRANLPELVPRRPARASADNAPLVDKGAPGRTCSVVKTGGIVHPHRSDVSRRPVSRGRADPYGREGAYGRAGRLVLTTAVGFLIHR
jgi:hypothetical protein